MRRPSEHCRDGMLLPRGVEPGDWRTASPDTTWLDSHSPLPSPRPPARSFADVDDLEEQTTPVKPAEECECTRGRRCKWLAGGLCVGASILLGVCAGPARGQFLPAQTVPDVLLAAHTRKQVSTVVLIRHCDKDEDYSATHCTPKGVRRAAWLPSLFDGDRFDPPSYLYARKPEKPRNVMRSIETLEPMSRTFGLDIDVHYGEKDNEKLAEDVKRHLTSEGPVVVAWKHLRLPSLAKAFGMKEPGTWEADDFDSMYVFTFDGDKLVSSKKEKEGYAE